MKKKILFICTHNSARSQMAEGYMNAKYGDRYEVFSGGTEPGQVHPMAIAVMKEIGIDISGHRSNSSMNSSGRELRRSSRSAIPHRKHVRSSPGQSRKFTRVFRILRHSPGPMRKSGLVSGG